MIMKIASFPIGSYVSFTKKNDSLFPKNYKFLVIDNVKRNYKKKKYCIIVKDPGTQKEYHYPSKYFDVY